MTTITISRQLGRLGTQIGHQVADQLGFRIVWREVINRAALQAGAPEMALATIDVLGLLDLHPSEEARRAYDQAVRDVMEVVAA